MLNKSPSPIVCLFVLLIIREGEVVAMKKLIDTDQFEDFSKEVDALRYYMNDNNIGSIIILYILFSVSIPLWILIIIILLITIGE